MRLKYQDLTDNLVAKLPPRYQANFYSWMDNGEMIDEGKIVTDKGEILFYLEYSAELFFHELPFKQINPLQIMAAINLWLAENDLERYTQDEYKTPFDLTLLDDELADLSFTLKFREPIYLNQITETEKDLDTETEIWTAETVQEIDVLAEIEK